MRFEYDLSSAPVLRPVDDGIYLLKVISSKEKKTDKDNDQITYEFQILQPESVTVDDAKVERLYKPYFISKEDPVKSLGFLRELFEACEKIIPGNMAFDTQDVYGCVFGAEVIKVAGTPEFPNPRNDFRRYFKQNDCPPCEVKPKEG